MFENIGVIIGIVIGAAGSISGIITSVYLFRQLKRAEVRLKEYEVRSKEISTADEMIDLVKKAYAELENIKRDIVESNKKENEKLRKIVARFERAVKAIGSCPYSDDCPVTAKLRCEKDADENGGNGQDRISYNPRDAPGHGGKSGGRQQPDSCAD